MVDEKDEMVLITVKLTQADLSIASVAQSLGVSNNDIDAGFGIVPVDPERSLYAVMLAVGKVTAVASRLGEDMEGPFADPEISPFGPVK